MNRNESAASMLCGPVCYFNLFHRWKREIHKEVPEALSFVSEFLIAHTRRTGESIEELGVSSLQLAESIRVDLRSRGLAGHVRLEKFDQLSSGLNLAWILHGLREKSGAILGISYADQTAHFVLLTGFDVNNFHRIRILDPNKKIPEWGSLEIREDNGVRKLFLTLEKARGIRQRLHLEDCVQIEYH